jgi:hypothetical protein
MSKRNPVLTAFGSNVRKRRELKELTQEGLAERQNREKFRATFRLTRVLHSKVWINILESRCPTNSIGIGPMQNLKRQ